MSISCFTKIKKNKKYKGSSIKLRDVDDRI